ncbi:uncharacterized protein LOC131150203 [Malania oleifera]|uniref:uncharacterized protein LOC131150203 n=1 Tax=Malania oleifera TaxID=397392 RepID=UPI0025AE7F4A|nr:uncharacterized protein LOC131150203 [Malania oleifera]
MEVEDDVFFADLSKRISLLIMDDDEDPALPSPSVSLQGFSRAIYPTEQLQYPPILFEQSCRGERESKGTGVFIPQSSRPRRKSSKERKSFNPKSKHQPADYSRGSSNHRASYAYNNYSPSCNCCNPKN